MIDQLNDTYPVRQLCETLDCPPSTYYYQSQAGSDADLTEAIEDMLMRWPFYGYRRVHKQLQRQDWLVGETRVRRVLKVMGHTARVGRVRVRTTDSSHPHWRYPNLLKRTRPKYPDHVWVADITYIRLGWRFIYLRGGHKSKRTQRAKERATLRHSQSAAATVVLQLRNLDTRRQLNAIARAATCHVGQVG